MHTNQNKADTLYENILHSEKCITRALYKPEYKNSQNSLPQIEETFSFFREYLELNPLTHIFDLPSAPLDLKSIVPGLYKKDNLLICATKLDTQSFKYRTMYTGALLNESCVQSELDGIYLSILKNIASTKFFEPTSFSYLLREEFFHSESNRFIVPLLSLPSTIPDALIHLWPFLAMRHLSTVLSPTLEYKYLATEDEEIRLLMEWGLF